MLRITAFLFSFWLFASPLWACDVCKIFLAQTSETHLERGFFSGANVDYSHFGSIQLNGKEVPNVFGQKLNSVTTNLYVGFQPLAWLGGQVNVPLVYKDYQRIYGDFIERGSVSGMGDTSFLLSVQPLLKFFPDSLIGVSAFGGIIFPTGDINELKRDLFTTPPCSQTRTTGTTAFRQGHAGHAGVSAENNCTNAPTSAIHGHELSLGTGAFAAVTGLQARTTMHRIYAQGGIQYVMNTTNDFGYKFGNNLSWDVQAGAYPLLSHTYSLALGAVLAGFDKQFDTYLGFRDSATRSTEISAGPEIRFTLGKFFLLKAGADFPLFNHNSDLQSVADFRVHSSLGLFWNLF